MLRSVDLRGWPPSLDRGVLGGQAEGVVAHRAQHLEAAAAAQVRDDVADRVVEDVPHVQLARGVREHLDDVGLAGVLDLARAPGSATRRPARPPRRAATSPRSPSGRIARVVISSPGTKKPLGREARGKLSRRSPRRSLRYARSCFTAAHASTVPRAAARVAGRRAGSSAGLARERARGALRDAARRLLRGDAARARAARSARAAPDALVVYGTKAFPNVALLRLLAEEGLGADVVDARRARVRARRRASTATGSSCTATTSRTRSCARRPRRARSSCSTRPTSRRARPRPASGACSCGSRPGVEADTHEAIRTGHRGSKFGLDAGRRARRDPGRPRGRPRRRGPPRPRRLAARRRCARTSQAVELLADFAARCRDELGWTPAVVDLGGGFGIRHVADEPEPPLEELVAHGRRSRATGVGDARAARAASDPRAGPRRSSARRRSRSTASARSSARASGATSRSTAACPTTRGRSSTARATRRCSRTGPTSRRRGAVHVAGQALRVGRRADRARRSCRSRGAATCSPCRRPARTRSAMARTTTACRGPPPSSSRTARRALIRRRETVDDLLAREV